MHLKTLDSHLWVGGGIYSHASCCGGWKGCWAKFLFPFLCQELVWGPYALLCVDSVDSGVAVLGRPLGGVSPSCLPPRSLLHHWELWVPGLVAWAEQAPPITPFLVPQHAVGKRMCPYPLQFPEATRGPSWQHISSPSSSSRCSPLSHPWQSSLLSFASSQVQLGSLGESHWWDAVACVGENIHERHSRSLGLPSTTAPNTWPWGQHLAKLISRSDIHQWSSILTCSWL